MRVLLIMYALGIIACNMHMTVYAKNNLITLSRIEKLVPSSNQVMKNNMTLADVTFIFDDAIVVNQQPLKNEKHKEAIRFFVPNAVTSLAQGDIIKENNQLYTVAMRSINHPMAGIQYDITYNPEKVSFKHDIYQRVNHKYKLVFHFYDKKLRDSMQLSSEIPMIIQAAVKPSIVIDYGHGGADTGVIGCNALPEKTICLAVGQKITDLLKKKGFLVTVVRDIDTDVSMERRIQLIHDIAPHMVLSIHANAAHNPLANGIETYYFDHWACKKHGHDTTEIPVNIYQQKIASYSKQLALCVQKNIIAIVQQQYTTVRDRHIKPEALQLLMGANTPSSTSSFPKIEGLVILEALHLCATSMPMRLRKL